MAKPPAAEKLSRVVRWVIIAFFAYAVMHAFVKPTDEPAQIIGQTGTTTVPAKDCGNRAASSFPAMAFLPSFTPQLRAEDEVEGKGEPAVCGQKATISYEYDTRKDNVIFSTQDLKKQVEEVRIGGGELLPGLEQSIIGMKKGGERTVSIPPALAFHNVGNIKALRHGDLFTIPPSPDIKNEVVLAKVKLIALSPETPSSSLPLRIIDTRFSTDTPAMCGNTVSFAMKIWKMDGTLIFSTADQPPVIFTIGASEVPLGLEEGISGMTNGSQRLIIMPPDYAKPLDPHATPLKALEGVHWPENEIVLVEMSQISVVEKPAASAQK